MNFWKQNNELFLTNYYVNINTSINKNGKIKHS